jgi:AcrR family transcriptional regulator
METAMNVYSRNGFGVPSDVIASEAGVSHGTIFVHFPSLKDLLVVILQKFFVKMGGRLHDLPESGRGIEEFLDAHIEAIAEYEDFYRRLVNERCMLPEEASRILDSVQSMVAGHFEAAAKRGIASGAVVELPVHFLWGAWLGLVHHYMGEHDAAPPGESALRRNKDELIGNFLKLVGK